MKARVFYRWLTKVSCLVVVAGYMVGPAAQDGLSSDASKSEDSPSMRAYKDPKTGKLGVPPAGERPKAAPRAAERTLGPPPEELVEVPSPVPGGGAMVDLKGQFRSHTTATKDADGKIRIDCQPGTHSQ
jgi:hypothetical protein